MSWELFFPLIFFSGFCKKLVFFDCLKERGSYPQERAKALGPWAEAAESDTQICPDWRTHYFKTIEPT